MLKSSLLASLPLILAQAPNSPPPGLAAWLLNLLYVVGIFFFLIKGIAESRSFFGRKPSLDDALSGKADGKTVEEVRLNIAGLVPMPVFHAYCEDERRRDTGLEKQISEARHDARDADNAIAVRVEEQYETLTRSIGAIEARMATGFKDVEEKRSTNIGVLHRDLKEAEKAIAGIRSDTESHTRHLSAMQTTLENILQRLPRRT